MPTKKQILEANEYVLRTPLGLSYRYSKDWLREMYGVENLSLIESVHLRNIVAECIENCVMETACYLNREISQMSITEVEHEAPARWLLYLYGLKHRDLFDQLEIWDNKHPVY